MLSRCHHGALHAGAVESQILDDDRIFETEVPLDAHIACVEETVDHRPIDHEGVIEVETDKIERGGTRAAAEHRADDPDSAWCDGHLLLRCGAFDNI